MFLCKHFVYLHLPKTGGTFLHDVLTAHSPETWDIQPVPGHGSVRDIPERYSDLPVIGFIRNPWDYYVSWYTYLMHNTETTPSEMDPQNLFQQASCGGSNDFRTTLLNIMDKDNLRKSDTGALTAYASWTFGIDSDAELDNNNIKIGQTENLREDMIGILEDLAISMPNSLKDSLLHDPPKNAMDRPPYQEFYDEETKSLVEYKDRFIIQRFGYSF
ncbi:MAG: hypothetical protein OEY67_06835 [Gammaproteobacteria bacterium]|nr:hypothetical protein [Gammaproteobacteria bacterium]